MSKSAAAVSESNRLECGTSWRAKWNAQCAAAFFRLAAEYRDTARRRTDLSADYRRLLREVARESDERGLAEANFAKQARLSALRFHLLARLPEMQVESEEEFRLVPPAAKESQCAKNGRPRRHGKATAPASGAGNRSAPATATGDRTASPLFAVADSA